MSNEHENTERLRDRERERDGERMEYKLKTKLCKTSKQVQVTRAMYYVAHDEHAQELQQQQHQQQQTRITKQPTEPFKRSFSFRFLYSSQNAHFPVIMGNFWTLRIYINIRAC